MTTATPSGGSPSQIVMPYDGSDLSLRALPVAHSLARGTGDTLVLLQAVGHDKEIDEAKTALAKTVNTLITNDVNVETVVTVGKPAECINTVAADRNARLVVMATHGRSGFGRWIYGSVADEVMRTGTVPTVLIPAAYTQRPASGDILVALDGSANAEQGLQGAIGLAKKLGAGIRLVRIVVPMLVTDGGLMLEPVVMEPIDAGPDETEANAYLTRAAAYVSSQGVPVEKQVVVGDTQINTGMLIAGLIARETATLLDRVADEHGCRLVTVSTQGLSGLGRALMGSVATAVIQHAHVPVLITRSAENAAAVIPA